MNTVSLVFALVANFMLLVLFITFIVGYRLRKKLATIIVTLSQTKPLKALEIEGLYTTKAPTLPVQTEDDTVIIKNCGLDSHFSNNIGVSRDDPKENI